MGLANPSNRWLSAEIVSLERSGSFSLAMLTHDHQRAVVVQVTAGSEVDR